MTLGVKVGATAARLEKNNYPIVTKNILEGIQGSRRETAGTGLLDHDPPKTSFTLSRSKNGCLSNDWMARFTALPSPFSIALGPGWDNRQGRSVAKPVRAALTVTPSWP
jgi:hypothetical protein